MWANLTHITHSSISSMSGRCCTVTKICTVKNRSFIIFLKTNSSLGTWVTNLAIFLTKVELFYCALRPSTRKKQQVDSKKHVLHNLVVRPPRPKSHDHWLCVLVIFLFLFVYVYFSCYRCLWPKSFFWYVELELTMFWLRRILQFRDLKKKSACHVCVSGVEWSAKWSYFLF